MSSPTKPTSARGGSRPQRRSSFTASVAAMESSADAPLPSDSLPLPVRPQIPPKPPTPAGARRPARAMVSAPMAFSMDDGDISDACGTPKRAERDSSLARGYDALGVELHRLDDSDVAEPHVASSSRALLPPLARPASPAAALPPVTPPLKRRPLSRPESRSFSTRPSAMELDLGVAQTSSSQPSAMMLDLGGDAHATLGRRGTPDQTYQKASRSSSTSIVVTKPSTKQSPLLLPPIAGAKSARGPMGKSSTHYRSGSVDSCMWGVAPVTGQREWSSGQLVF